MNQWINIIISWDPDIVIKGRVLLLLFVFELIVIAWDYDWILEN